MDFGLPSGLGLWSEVKTILSSIRDGLAPKDPFERNPYILAANAIGRGPNSPQTRAMLATLRGRAPDPHLRLIEIAQLMKNADVHASVDDFLRDHPSIRPEVKVAIATALFEKLFTKNDETKIWTRSSHLLSDRLHLSPAATQPTGAKNLLELVGRSCEGSKRQSS